MAKQSVPRTRKSKVADKPVARKARRKSPAVPSVARPLVTLDARSELVRTIAELNEVRMRLDAAVRRLVQSTSPTGNGAVAASELETLRLRLLGKLDRIREKLVVRVAEERTAKLR